MPKKLRMELTEPPIIFDTLLAEFNEGDSEFVVHTPDSVVEQVADELIAQHYPPQSELPLD